MEPAVYKVQIYGNPVELSKSQIVALLDLYEESMRQLRDMDELDRLKYFASEPDIVDNILDQHKFIEKYSWIRHD